MRNDTLFVGLEVDDRAYHAHIIKKSSLESWDFVTKPLLSSLIAKLEKLKVSGTEIRICYEATYIGFSLQRKLLSKGFHCDIIAPSLVPRQSGRKVKTDRVDAKKLAKYYSQDLLTIVHVPDEEQESVRDLIRSRNFINRKLAQVRTHVTSVCRRNSLNYREAVKKEGASYWTQPHLQWLEREVSLIKLLALKNNLSTLLMTLKQLEAQVKSYDEEILVISRTPTYEKPVQALCAYRGISTNTAMVLTTEIGDAARFNHPKKLTSYSGLDIIEKSSGANEKKYSITRMGNHHIRTAVVESCQSAIKPVRISAGLIKRRAGTEQKYVEIADRCMIRLNKKAMKLTFAGKQKNKVKVACAREMLGFVWESMKAAQGI